MSKRDWTKEIGSSKEVKLGTPGDQEIHKMAGYGLIGADGSVLNKFRNFIKENFYHFLYYISKVTYTDFYQSLFGIVLNNIRSIDMAYFRTRD